jgi:hypothetical protein
MLPRMGWVKSGGNDLHVPAPVQLEQSRYSQRRLLNLHWLQSLKVLASRLAQATKYYERRDCSLPSRHISTDHRYFSP